jgi:hypothetical protein
MTRPWRHTQMPGLALYWIAAGAKLPSSRPHHPHQMACSYLSKQLYHCTKRLDSSQLYTIHACAEWSSMIRNLIGRPGPRFRHQSIYCRQRLYYSVAGLIDSRRLSPPPRYPQCIAATKSKIKLVFPTRVCPNYVTEGIEANFDTLLIVAACSYLMFVETCWGLSFDPNINKQFNSCKMGVTSIDDSSGNPNIRLVFRLRWVVPPRFSPLLHAIECCVNVDH